MRTHDSATELGGTRAAPLPSGWPQRTAGTSSTAAPGV